MNSLLPPLIGVAAWFVGLSILVQVLQELWKFVTTSKSRAFEKALADFLGPFVVRRLQQDPLLTVRGPLQFRRVSIAGRVLPLNADDLVASLAKSAPAWHRLVQQALIFESNLQNGTPAPGTPRFVAILKQLRRQLEDAAEIRRKGGDARLATDIAEQGDAVKVLGFLEQWRAAGDEPFDAAAVAKAFEGQFQPHVATIAQHYDQFLASFAYQYRRRNLRQTFIFGMLVAVVLNLPFEQILVRATALSPDQAIALAEQAQTLYTRASEAGDQAQVEQLRALGADALNIAKSATDLACSPREFAEAPPTSPTGGNSQERRCEQAMSIDYFLDPLMVWERLKSGDTASPRFLFGCLLTAVLITFGAPFWNDVTSTLLRAARPSRDQQNTAAPDRPTKTEVA